MPELSRFYGIIISMFAEAGGKHHLPHFHATYQDKRASFGIRDIEILAGELPRRQQRIVQAWAEIHNDELMACWNRLQAGHSVKKIEPLK